MTKPLEYALPSGPDVFSFDRLLRDARDGSNEALGRLLETCRPYLLKLANEDLPKDLHAKTAPSDVVQETFFHADRAFADFRGQSKLELLGWLKRILNNEIKAQGRAFFDTDKRQLGREVEPAGDKKHLLLEQLAESGLSPRGELIGRELRDYLQATLAQLEEDHRQAIQLRVYEQLPYEEIGRRLNRTDAAARKLFERALESMRRLMVADDES